LYARGDLQRHIARLTAARAEVERDTRRDFIDRFERLFEDCLKHGERATALRALTAQLRLRGLDARSLERRAQAERDSEARADDLRDRMRVELYAEIRAEVLDELERIGRDAHAPERQEPAHEVAGAEQTMTNHDVCAKSAAPAAPAALDGAARSPLRPSPPRPARPDRGDGGGEERDHVIFRSGHLLLPVRC
ncbi:MAG TPA: hypothetical protein VK943_10085, partial [Arenibaculum sp.]|nr:hypothetical protein [Arenibaculum sp.]